jgi:hypothetical protein
MVLSRALASWWRACALAGAPAGIALAAAIVSFCFLVPETRAERQQQHALVLATGALWFAAQALTLPPAFAVYAAARRRTIGLAGSGLALSLGGSCGILFYLAFLFPELFGFRPDTIDKAQTAVLMQAAGELGAAAFTAGWLLLALALIISRSLALPAPLLLAAGALVVPLGLVDLGWLALGAVMLGAGMGACGYVLAHTPRGQHAGPVLSLDGPRRRQFRL